MPLAQLESRWSRWTKKLMLEFSSAAQATFCQRRSLVRGKERGSARKMTPVVWEGWKEMRFGWTRSGSLGERIWFDWLYEGYYSKLG